MDEPRAFAQPPVATAIGQSNIAPLGGPHPAGTRTALRQSGFVDPEEFQFHGIGVSAVPRRSLQHHQHSALRAAGAVELHNNEASATSRPRRTATRTMAPARCSSRSNLLSKTHRASQFQCLSYPASGAEHRVGCGPFFVNASGVSQFKADVKALNPSRKGTTSVVPQWPQNRGGL